MSVLLLLGGTLKHVIEFFLSSVYLTALLKDSFCFQIPSPFYRNADPRLQNMQSFHMIEERKTDFSGLVMAFSSKEPL